MKVIRRDRSAGRRDNLLHHQRLGNPALLVSADGRFPDVQLFRQRSLREAMSTAVFGQGHV